MAVVCLDTQVLIWGVQHVATPGQEAMITRARALLAQLDQERAQVVIPSIVIGEFLLGLPLDQHARFQDIITRRFVVVPYDLRASLNFARIWHAKAAANVIAEMTSAGATRPELRADTMIVATALATGATLIYGHDKRVRKLAENYIRFQDIAELMIQTTFLGDETG